MHGKKERIITSKHSLARKSSLGDLAEIIFSEFVRIVSCRGPLSRIRELMSNVNRNGVIMQMTQNCHI